MTDKIRVAVLNVDNILIGSREITASRFLPDKHIDIGDLPADGTYQWTGKSFEHISAPPHTPADVIYELINALDDNNPELLTPKVVQWRDWYKRYVLGEQ